MTKKESITKKVVAITVAAAGMGFLASCSPGDLIENAAGEAAEKAIESATGADIEVDEDGGSMSFQDEDGETDISFGNNVSLPDGFPDEVPLIEGNIQTAAKTTQDGDVVFTVNIGTEGSVSDARTDATELLLSAGFTEAEAVEMGDQMQLVTFAGDGPVETVTVNLLGDGESLTVGYMVYLN